MTADPAVVEDVFLSALERSTDAARAACLDEACGEDAGLRARVEALLAAHRRAGAFLETPLLGSGETGDDFSLGAPPASPEPPTIELDGYTECQPVARGGMGIVYRARDSRLDRVVAIKMLAPELVSQATARQRFLREARAAAAIRHENVVTIHSIVESGGAPFLVMEWVEGRTLQEVLAGGERLETGKVLRIAGEIARGLAAAHALGLVHRDVKPANVLVESGTGRVKITDFGLARAVDDVGLTRVGMIAGTPQYMSPEQADGKPVDHRTDLFGLGAVVYALFTGRPPFRGHSTAAVLRAICEREPAPLSEARPDLSPAVVDAVERLLCKDPAGRFPSADAAAERFAELRDGNASSNSSPAGRRWWLPLAGGASAAAVATVILLPEFQGSADVSPGPGDKGRELASTADTSSDQDSRSSRGDRQSKDGGEADIEATPPTGDESGTALPREKPADVDPEDSEPHAAAVPVDPPSIASPDSLVERRQMTAPDRLYGLAVARDGSRAFAVCADKLVYAWNPQTGEPLFQLPQRPRNLDAVVLSPDGTRLATCEADRKIHLWDAGTGEELLQIPTAVPVRDAAFSPDGGELVVSLASRPARGEEPRGPAIPFDRKLHVYDAGTGRPLRTLPRDDGRRFSDVDWSGDGRWIAAGTYSGKALLIDASTGAVELDLVASGAPGPAHQVLFTADSKRLYAAGSGNVLWCWSVPDGVQQSFHVFPQSIVRFDVSPDGRWLAAGGALEVRMIDLNDPDGPVKVRKRPGHTSPIRDVAFVSTRPQLLSSGWDGTLRLWGPAEGE